MGKKTKRKVYRPDKLPKIVVETPQGQQLAFDDAQANNSIETTEKINVHGEVPPEMLAKLFIRRNSVSMPNLEELERRVLQDQIDLAQMQDDENVTRSEFSTSSGSIHVTSDDDETQFDLDDDDIEKRVPLRNVRKKSVSAPLPKLMIYPREFDQSAPTSPAPSITSVNSLASLLKEKIQNIPQTLRKKKPKHYKIRAFVGILFITIVFLVGYAYLLYQQKLLQKAYFEKIKFSKSKREIKIFNKADEVIIKGNLGTTLSNEKVFPCNPQDVRDDGSICLEWTKKARLYIELNQLNDEVRCYNLQWSALNDAINPTDCYDLSTANEYWYGGGQSAENSWPLNKAHHDFTPFITGRVENGVWGSILKRYFINSKGAAITIDDSTPLHVSINNRTVTKRKEICFQSRYDDFAYYNRMNDYPQLNYSICTASNTSILHSILTEKDFWDGQKPEEKKIIDSLLTEPLWEIKATSKDEFVEGTLSKFINNSVEFKFLRQGHVLINEFWQKQIGDFTLDLDRFPNFETTMETLDRRGFRVVFTIQPFISTESINFAEAVKKKLLISERGSNGRIPALTRYKSLKSAGVLDVTINETIPWLIQKLRASMEKYKFNAYYLDLGTAYDIPHYYECERPLINPDEYKTLFVNGLKGNLPVNSLFGLNSAIRIPREPNFVSLPPFESSWEGLRRVIPTILTYGLLGYPYIIPGAVGGDYDPSDFVNTSNVGEFTFELPDKELYVRWFQLATFLPVIRFTYLPSYYKDEKVLEMAKIMTNKRQQIVIPALKAFQEKVESVSYNGLPLIRPLWMLQCNDPACYVISDEFAIDDKLIIAPILEPGVKQREVYLPAGVWSDGIDGSLRKGNRWIHDYKVEENQIAFFERMPDDTRF